MNVRSLAIARGTAIIGGTAALIAGATLAVLTTNPVNITGTTLGVNEETAALKIYDFASNTFSTTSANPSGDGAINLVLKKDEESAKQYFYLQNNGTVDLGLTATATMAEDSTLDPTKVTVRFYDDESADANEVGTGTLAQLLSPGGIALNTTEGSLPAGASGDSNQKLVDHAGNYRVSFELTDDANGSDTLDDLNIQFVGTDVSDLP